MCGSTPVLNNILKWSISYLNIRRYINIESRFHCTAEKINPPKRGGFVESKTFHKEPVDFTDKIRKSLT